jgi:hypothetical protein
MKLLNHPAVVALLGVAAVGILADQALQNHWVSWPVWATAKPPAAVVKPAAQTTASETNSLADPLALIDASYPQTHLSNWVKAPLRDPFWQAKPVAPAGQTKTVHLLKLKAIWRQSGVSIAAINQGLYRQGDSVDGCLVDMIEDTGVWLVVNGERGFLPFTGPHPANEPHN